MDNIQNNIDEIIDKIYEIRKKYFLDEYKNVRSSLLKAINNLESAKTALLKNEKDKDMEGQMSIEDFIEYERE